MIGCARFLAGRPLGATWDGRVNFALFSEHADGVELCLFDERAPQDEVCTPLTEYTDQVWHAYLQDVRPSRLYGYRVHGPWDPARGPRFNPRDLISRMNVALLKAGKPAQMAS